MSAEAWIALLGIVVATFGAITSFVFNRIFGQLKDLYRKKDTLSDKLEALRLDVAKNYHSKPDMENLLMHLKEFLNERFSHLESKMNVKNRE
jgi:hypothetical protein